MVTSGGPPGHRQHILTLNKVRPLTTIESLAARCSPKVHLPSCGSGFMGLLPFDKSCWQPQQQQLSNFKQIPDHKPDMPFYLHAVAAAAAAAYSCEYHSDFLPSSKRPDRYWLGY